MPTHFSEKAGSGNGFLTFDIVEQASSVTDAVESNYLEHAAAAREIAIEYFGSDRVLVRMLEEIFASD